MRFSRAIDLYVASMWGDGGFTSAGTEKGYRWTLNKLAEQVENRDPATVTRDDVKRFLARWQWPNTKALHRAHCVSFFDWCMEEGYRIDNPARQTKKPRKRPPRVYRLTGREIAALRDAVRTTRERRLVDLGLFAGLRAQELRLLQGRHFRRPGWVWVSPDIGKGGKFRWQPVPAELSETWWEIAGSVADDEFVLPRVEEGWWGAVRIRNSDPSRPMGYKSIHDLVGRLGRRAGIKRGVHPHLLRHAFGQRAADHTGDIRLAQALLGHASLSATQVYVGRPSLEQLSRAVEGFGYGPSGALRPSEPQQAAGGRLLRKPAGSVVERSGALLAPVLAGLWAKSGLRRAARETAGVDA